MILFSLCRVGFLIFNHRLFPGTNAGELLRIMAGGLIFDVSAAVYVNILYIFFHILPFDFRYKPGFQKIMSWLFFITNGIAVALNGMDFVYYRFIGKRATADVFGTFRNEENVIKLFFRFLADYWMATLFVIALWALMAFLYKIYKPVIINRQKKVLRFIFSVLMIPVVIFLVIGAARGGYKHSTRPITISNAAKYVDNPANSAIVLNTPFSLLRTFGKKPLLRYNYFGEDQLNSIYNPHYTATGKTFVPQNVVIIILESFAREYIGALNPSLEGGKYKGYTPFIDSLLQYSLTFDVSVSNGRKSIDAMPSILASIPSLETPYIISHYANNQINALPSLLKRKGYYTAFFHGAPNGSMGFDSFAKMAGFDDYYGLNEYPEQDDFDGMWGVWDEPFFMYFASKLNEFPQPFLASVFSISSHHPFEVPAQYRGRFKKGPVPIAEVIGYTDYALSRFFKKASSDPWYYNTLFIITADHTNETIHKEYQSSFGVYSIPVIFYKPGSNLRGIRNRIAQQIDIMPTVLNYLGYDEDFIAFGNDLFNDSGDSFAFNTNGNTYQLMMDDNILMILDDKTTGMFNYRSDSLLEKNLAGKDMQLQGRMEEKLKAIKQSYNSRLLDNKMVVK